MNSMAGKPKTAAARTPRLYDRIRDILELARASVARTVNTTQVVANWLVGREIVEEEQAGKRRAAYGAELLSDLAAKLTREFGTGYSVDNLELFRRFYLEYTRLLPDEKSETVRRISALSQKSDAVRRKSERRAAFIGAEKPHALRGELTNAVSALQIGYGVRDEFEDEAGSVSRMIRHAPRDDRGSPADCIPTCRGLTIARSCASVALKREPSTKLRRSATLGRRGNWSARSTACCSNGWRKAGTRRA